MGVFHGDLNDGGGTRAGRSETRPAHQKRKQRNKNMKDSQVIVMTADQLKQFAFTVLEEYRQDIEQRKAQEPETTGEVVYGLRGIMDLFGVSPKTACIYKKTFLREAVSQRGRKIVTDVTKARRLFDQYRAAN